jgi:hypothetical protein
MIAASWEEIDAADNKATKEPPVSSEDGVDPQIPGERNDGAPVTTGNRERLIDPSSSSNQTPSTTSYVQVGAPSITPTPQRGDERSLGFAANDHGHVGMTTRTTEESMSPPRPSFDRSHQSVPLIEATLVQDVPQEPVYIYINTNSGEGTVYDAFPMPAPEVNDAHGWSRISLKLRVIFIGSVLVAVAAIIAVVVVIADNKKEPSSPAVTTSTNSMTGPGTEKNTVSETTSSTTAPGLETNTASETSILRALCCFIDRVQCLTPSSFDANIRLLVRAPDEHSHCDQHEQHLQHDNARNEYRE